MREIPLSAIEDAARALYNPVVRTPLVQLDPSRSATARAPDADIFLTLKTLQPIGSFKIRGAHNVVRQPPDTAVRDGVWTVSAGHAAQGMALAARVRGKVVAVVSGDNIDLDALASLVAGSRGIDIGPPT